MTFNISSSFGYTAKNFRLIWCHTTSNFNNDVKTLTLSYNLNSADLLYPWADRWNFWINTGEPRNSTTSAPTYDADQFSICLFFHGATTVTLAWVFPYNIAKKFKNYSSLKIYWTSVCVTSTDHSICYFFWPISSFTIIDVENWHVNGS